MRLIRFATVAATLAIILSVPSFGQAVIDKNRSFFSPDQQWGFGMNNRGMTIQYAMGPAFHIGLNMALDFNKDSARSDAYFDFGPYAKFILSGDVVKPYIHLGVGLVQPNTGSFVISKDNDSNDTTPSKLVLPDPQIRAYLGLGFEHFFNQNVGIIGQVTVVDAKLAGQHVENGQAVSDPKFEFGLLGATAGVEFFF
ncbi:MAG: hypothetical protein H7X80_04605 [bacterium]|nr:hypothetical protein [Candidatus Kapabacteria bacterium]